MGILLRVSISCKSGGRHPLARAADQTVELVNSVRQPLIEFAMVNGMLFRGGLKIVMVNRRDRRRALKIRCSAAGARLKSGSRPVSLHNSYDFAGYKSRLQISKTG